MTGNTCLVVWSIGVIREPQVQISRVVKVSNVAGIRILSTFSPKEWEGRLAHETPARQDSYLG